MLIRAEYETDYAAVYQVVKSAFASAEHADGNEQDLVEALRTGDAYIPELSLVAIVNDEVVGHIMFTKMLVGDATALALAPLSIHPTYQRQGIGAKLITEGHRKAKELGYDYTVVLGSETYYPKFGYQPAKELGIEIPEGIPEANFMACKLNENAKPIGGKVQYAKEFGM